jgi:hypothetical protein
MLGHGSPDGLFSVGQFETDNSLIVDSSLISLLAEREENIYIWCHANKFVERYNLKGFYTGMFISEDDIIDESNNAFSSIVSKYINESKSVIYKKVLEEYQVIANRNIIAAYNLKLLKFN